MMSQVPSSSEVPRFWTLSHPPTVRGLPMQAEMTVVTKDSGDSRSRVCQLFTKGNINLRL